ncbi:MAG: hypothetical protein KDE09_16050, partial [Anaerolineales bacterium]|nr:hypothetical protein [Anaerolineales bacterium]
GRELYIKEERDGLYAVNALGQPLGKVSRDTALGFAAGERVVVDGLYLHQGRDGIHMRLSLKTSGEPGHDNSV